MAGPGLGSCYYPGGQWAPQNQPCDPYAYTTLCCPLGWTCMSNLVCAMTDPATANASFPLGTSLRGTCTNPSWNNTACGEFCLNEPVAQDNGVLVPCGDNLFCCGAEVSNGTCNCDSGKGTFDVGVGTAQTILGVTGTVYTQTPSALVSSRTHFSITSSSMATSSSSSVADPAIATHSVTSSLYLTASTLSTSISQPPNLAVSTSSSSSLAGAVPNESSAASPLLCSGNGTHMKVALGIGLGLGLPLFLVCLAPLVWFVSRRRRHEQQSHESRSQMAENPASSTGSTGGPYEPYNGPPDLPEAYKDYSTTGRTMKNTPRASALCSNELYTSSTRGLTPSSPLATGSPAPRLYADMPSNAIHELDSGLDTLATPHAASRGPYSATQSIPAPSYHSIATPERLRAGVTQPMHSRDHARNPRTATSAPSLGMYDEEQAPQPYTRFRN